jgi:hypothetical protein
MERLGDAATTNVADAVACATAWAGAVGAAAGASAPPPAPASADALARSLVSAWVGGLRAVAVTAAAVTDAAAIMSSPPQLVAYYTVDLAELFPGRSRSMKLAIKGVTWTSPNSSGAVPFVSIVDAQPVGVPGAGGADLVRFRVRPSVSVHALAVLVEFATIGTPAVDPVLVTVRLGPENVVVDP